MVLLETKNNYEQNGCDGTFIPRLVRRSERDSTTVLSPV